MKNGHPTTYHMQSSYLLIAIPLALFEDLKAGDELELEDYAGSSYVLPEKDIEYAHRNCDMNELCLALHRSSETGRFEITGLAAYVN